MKGINFVQRSTVYLILFSILSFALIFFLDVQEKNNGWRKDLSFNAYSTTSAETQKLLSGLDKDIYLYTFYTQGNRDEYIHTLLESYSRQNKRIKNEWVNLAENPNFLSKINVSGQNELSQDSILVFSPATNRYKILGPNDMYSLGFDIASGNYGISDLRYEKSITEAILYVNSDYVPNVYISTGHGETGVTQIQSLLQYLQLNGYDIQFTKQIPPDLEENSLLLINSPKKDLSEQELQNIQSFEKKGGSILVSLGYNDPSELPNFNLLLSSYGIEVLEGHIVANKSDTQSYYQEPSYLIPYMEKIEMLLPLITANKDLLLMPLPKAFALHQSNDYQNTALLYSGKRAERRSNTNDTVLDTGEMVLAAYSQKQLANAARPALVAIGSTLSITDEYIYSISFASEFVQTILNNLIPQKVIQTNIALKPALRPNLLPSSKNIGIAIILLIPLGILCVAIFVIRYRKSL